MHSKVFIVLALTSMACSHDVIKGSNRTEERLIYDEHLQASPAIWKQSSDVTVNASDHEVISKINVTDLRQDKDGDAQIVAGGVGQNNVTITIKSPTILRGYDFLIQVYAVAETKMDNAEPKMPDRTHPSDVTPEAPMPDKTQLSDVTTEAQLSTARNDQTIVTRDAEVTGPANKPQEVTESVSTEKPAEEVSKSTDIPAEVTAASELTKTFTQTTSDAMESEVPVEIEHQPKHL